MHGHFYGIVIVHLCKKQNIPHEMAPPKLRLWNEYSKYLTVNTRHTEPFMIDEVATVHTESYIYLGPPALKAFMRKQVTDHVRYRIHPCKEVVVISSKESRCAIQHNENCV